jgi:hypothetical protein
MVNADRVKEKLPGLLVDAKTTKHKAWNEFMRNRYRLRKLMDRNPQRFNCLIVQLCEVLEEIEKEIGN